MKNLSKIKTQKRMRRHKRVRAKISGTAKQPRFSVFRSNKAMFVQLIDDEKGITLVSAHTRELSNIKPCKNMSTKVALAYNLGKLLGKKALDKNIKKVVFDRGGYKYHGRVKAVADGARSKGLKF